MRGVAGIFLCCAVASCASPPPPPAVVDVAPPRSVAPVAAPEPTSAPPKEEPKKVAADEPASGWGRAKGVRRVQGQGYHYDVPSDWEELDASKLGPLIRHAHRTPRPRGSFAQNVNVASEPYTGDGPAYGAANRAELAKVSTIRDQRASHLGPKPGWDIEARWPNPGAVPYVTLQRYGTNGTNGFVITCSTGEAVFTEDRAACDDILESFRVE